MKIEVRIHPTETRHEFASVELRVQELDVAASLDINLESYLRHSRGAAAHALDFFFISAVVYGIDKLIGRSHFSNRWTRDLEVSMPVNNVTIWSDASEALTESLSFLTGDNWSFEFSETTTNWIQRRRNRRPPTPFPRTPIVSLLSGGLDSFIGALDFLAEFPDRQLLFASHYDGNVAGPAGDQNALKQLLNTHYPKRIQHLQIRTGVLTPKRISEETTKDWETDFKKSMDRNFRSRSFGFIGIAILAAHRIGTGTPILIPENGPIALNMPLNASRRGSCSTRTVHPWFLRSIQEVINAAGLDHKVSNPYATKTKGEMVSACKDQQALAIGHPLTNSCAKSGHTVHWDDRNAKACGRCVPCLFRRASLHAKGLDVEGYGFDILTKEPTEHDDFHALLGLIRRNPDDREIARRLMANGRLPIGSLGGYIDVEKRMIQEVKKWLSDKASKRIKYYARIK